MSEAKKIEQYTYLDADEQARIVANAVHDAERMLFSAELNLSVEESMLPGDIDDEERNRRLGGPNAQVDRARARLAALRERPELIDRPAAVVLPPPPAPSFPSEAP